MTFPCSISEMCIQQYNEMLRSLQRFVKQAWSSFILYPPWRVTTNISILKALSIFTAWDSFQLKLRFQEKDNRIYNTQEMRRNMEGWVNDNCV